MNPLVVWAWTDVMRGSRELKIVRMVDQRGMLWVMNLVGVSH